MLPRQNYDFGAHWTTRIVPHLDSPAMQRAVCECAESYLATFTDCGSGYEPNTPLAQYSSRDYYCMLMERKGDLYTAANVADLPRARVILFAMRVPLVLTDCHADTRPTR